MGAALLKELEAVDDLHYGLWEYNPGDHEPACRCAMQYVELVNGVYYRIYEHRSPDGITHTAFCLGPRGGPYTLDQYGREPKPEEPKPEPKKTSADRIAELQAKERGTRPVIKIALLPLDERAALANELAADPKNCRIIRKTFQRQVDGKWVDFVTEVVDGKWVTTQKKAF